MSAERCKHSCACGKDLNARFPAFASPGRDAELLFVPLALVLAVIVSFFGNALSSARSASERLTAKLPLQFEFELSLRQHWCEPTRQ